MIPDSVTSIGDNAFSNCPKLNSVTIPASVTEIGNGAFSKCPNITATVEHDSFASSYCAENNINVIYPDSFDWLSD